MQRGVVVALALVLLLVGVDLALVDQRAWTVGLAVLAVLLLGLLARAAGLGVADLGLGRDRLASGLRLGGLWSVAVVVGLVAALWLLPVAAAFDDDRTPSGLASVLLKILVVIPLRTVLLEELAFRGVLWGWLARSWGERAAAWGSALAFGVWHVPPGLVVLQTNQALSGLSAVGSVLVVAGIVVATTAAGLLFAGLRRRSGSLAAPALLHWTVNSAGTMAGHLLR